ncbi:MAG TPA: NADH-quinone oxidoreductase subunit M [bacterium]|nr:NADH-quinone oxidoreductase subunit M [bacterium]
MLLTLITFFPLLGGLLLLLIPKRQADWCKETAFGISLAPLLLCIPLLMMFPYGEEGFHLGPAPVSWIPTLGIDYRVGVDGLSLVLIVLTTLLTPLSILASFPSIQKHQKEFYFFMLLLETGILGTFIALDLFLFYLFWELMLVPMYFIIGVWGGQDRVYASIKFILYTAFGSALMLIVIFYLYFEANQALQGIVSFNFQNFTALRLDPAVQKWLFAGFVLAFLIKMPVFPLHTWLPYAHTEAPTAGSVILAGLLLKTGVYGFLRFAAPIFPEATVAFTPVLLVLAIIGVIYGALVAMAQSDVKRLVAYSSVSHMGLLLAGILAWNTQGIQGGIIQMINHGLSTGALFLIVGILYDRRHTREIREFGGLAKPMPVYAAFFMIFLLSSIGLPGLNGFIGEFLILIGLMGRSILWACLAATGVVLGAAYMLWLYQKMMFGPIHGEANQNLKDLTAREIIILLPIALLCFGIGLYPYPLQKTLEPPVKAIERAIQPHIQARPWHEAPLLEIETGAVIPGQSSP